MNIIRVNVTAARQAGRYEQYRSIAIEEKGGQLRIPREAYVQLKSDLDEVLPIVGGGLGDHVAMVTRRLGIDRVVHWLTRGKCGCPKRRALLNKLFPGK